MSALLIGRVLLFCLFSGALFSCEDDERVRHKPDQKVEFYSEPFDNMPLLNDIVMYQANERVFAASGSFNVITQRLDKIRSLGVNVLWLMPVNEQGKEKAFGSPYSVKDYTKTNPEYGSLDDLRTLVKEAHKRDMAVIIDWVANHTSWDHAWLKEHPGWYTLDSGGNPGPPAGTDWNDVVDLNYNNRDMWKEMIEAMKFWVREANIDGFRCDAADWVPVDFWREAIYQLRNMQTGRTILMLAEGTEPKNLQAGFDMDYGWNFCDVLEGVFNGTKTIASLYQSHFNEFEIIPAGKQKLRHNTNHDRAFEHSPVTKFQNAEGALASFVIATTLGGVPLIYSSQEVAYPNRINFFNYVAVNWESNPTVFAEYQKIMNIYNSFEGFRKGELKVYEHNDVVCFSYTLNSQEVFVVVNVRDKAVSFAAPKGLAGNQCYDMMNNSALQIAEFISLSPFQFLFLETE